MAKIVVSKLDSVRASMRLAAAVFGTMLASLPARADYPFPVAFIKDCPAQFVNFANSRCASVEYLDKIGRYFFAKKRDLYTCLTQSEK